MGAAVLEVAVQEVVASVVLAEVVLEVVVLVEAGKKIMIKYKEAVSFSDDGLIHYHAPCFILSRSYYKANPAS